VAGRVDVPSLNNTPGMSGNMTDICQNLRTDPVPAPRYEKMDVRNIHVRKREILVACLDNLCMFDGKNMAFPGISEHLWCFGDIISDTFICVRFLLNIALGA
jgi:hypothetical protein